jgi:hypothetical protein
MNYLTHGILIILIIIFSVGCFANDKLLIIGEDIPVYEDNLNSLKVTSKCRLFDEIDLIEKKIINQKINIVTMKKIKGWVDLLYTSYIPENWRVINELINLNFYLPREGGYKVFRGTENNDNQNITREDKLIADAGYYIILEIIKTNIDEYVKRYPIGMMGSVRKGFRKINYNGNIIFYDFSTDGYQLSTELSILFKTSNSYLYKFLISLGQNPSEEKKLIAKKILFSILKNTKLSSLE